MEKKDSVIRFVPADNTTAKLAPSRDPIKSGKLPVKTGPAFAPIVPGKPMARQVKVVRWGGFPQGEPLSLRGPHDVGQECKLQPVATQEPKQAPPAVKAPAIEDHEITVSVERLVFLQRVEKLMANEARIHALETENGVLQESIKTLGGTVATLESEIRILKAKKE